MLKSKDTITLNKIVNTKNKDKRSISTGQLNVLLQLHTQPINQLVLL